jgi:hypothetical protein
MLEGNLTWWEWFAGKSVGGRIFVQRRFASQSSRSRVYLWPGDEDFGKIWVKTTSALDL